MSPPTQPKLLQINALGLEGKIPGGRFDELTSALRRRHRDDALGILDRWPLHGYWSAAAPRQPQIELTRWLQQEVRLHVEGGRFQHALALVERYATLPVPLDAAGAKTLFECLEAGL